MPEQMNAGFFRMKSNERTRAFVQRLVASAEQRETWKHFQPDEMTDQHYFNMLLANGAEAAGLSFSTLNPDHYLNGWNLKSNMSWDYSGESGGTWKPLDATIAKFVNLNFAHSKTSKDEWLKQKCWWHCTCEHMARYCNVEEVRQAEQCLRQQRKQQAQQAAEQLDGAGGKKRKKRKKRKRVAI